MSSDRNADMANECGLLHVRCGACGSAIHTGGGCDCEDNRHHPVADLRKDLITHLRADVERLRQYPANPSIEELDEFVKCELVDRGMSDAEMNACMLPSRLISAADEICERRRAVAASEGADGP